MNRLFAARPTAAQVDIALLVIRIVLGIILTVHGGQKVFTFGLAGVAGSMAEMGVPLPSVIAPLVMVAEFVGGIAIIAGLLTRVTAIANVIVQVGAILLVHLPNGFSRPQGYEFNLALIAMALALAVAGAGRWSVDAQLAGGAGGEGPGTH